MIKNYPYFFTRQKKLSHFLEYLKYYLIKSNLFILFLSAAFFMRNYAKGQGIANTFPLSNASQKENLNDNFSEKVWARIFPPKDMGLFKKKVLAEQFHNQLEKKKFKAADEAVILAGLAALHAQDPESKYAALPLLQSAFEKYPDLRRDRELEKVWRTFRIHFSGKIASDEIILMQTAALLAGTNLESSDDPAFPFFRGQWLQSQGKFKESLAYMVKVPLSSPDYRRAKFAESLAHIQLNSINDAYEALQVVVSLDLTHAESGSSITTKSVQRLRELGVLTTARLLYEQGQFLESIAYYRTLAQDSFFFYESLHEQGWAYFMAGFPNRALGAEYAAQSPFFSEKFNPDSYFLNATLNYWLCEFEGANQSLTRFVAHTRNEGDLLTGMVRRYNGFAPDESLTRYSKLIEDSSRGVSARNLGLGPKTLASLKAHSPLTDSFQALNAMTLMRTQISQKTFYTTGKERLIKALGEAESIQRKALGTQVKLQLNIMASEFEKTLTQAKLLYLEILTARKDSLLGKDRSVRGQEFVGVEKNFDEFMGSTRSQQSWAQDKKEFWYDELGSYVYDLKSKCGGPG